MTYYRVLPSRADKMFRSGRTPMYTIKNELFTPAEVKKYSIPDKGGYYLHKEWVEEVNVPRSSTYFFFGARFCDRLVTVGDATVFM